MRLNLEQKKAPKCLDTRSVKRFLFFPKKIGNEIRWLERTEWVEVYLSYYPAGLPFMKLNGWIATTWMFS